MIRTVGLVTLGICLIALYNYVRHGWGPDDR